MYLLPSNTIGKGIKRKIENVEILSVIVAKNSVEITKHGWESDNLSELNEQ